LELKEVKKGRGTRRRGAAAAEPKIAKTLLKRSRSLPIKKMKERTAG